MRNSITFTPSHSVRRNRRFNLPFVVAILLAIGCSSESPLARSEGVATTAKTTATQDAESATPAEPATQTYAQKLAAALEQAAATKDAVVDQLSAAGEAGGQSASDSVTWATEMYNSLKEQGLTKADNTQQWLANDWKLAGAWEYHVETLVSDADIAAQLNELGKERWECFHVVPPAAGQVTTFYFKRPAQSYLNNLPMKDLMHLLPLMGTGGNDGQ